MVHVPERIPVRALRRAVEGAMGAGRKRRCCGRTVSSGMLRVGPQRRAATGDAGSEGETGLRGGARCGTAGAASKCFATREFGQVSGAVVERRCVVSFAWIVSSWPSAWQRCAARLN